MSPNQIESGEPQLPAGLQQVLDQLERDRMVAEGSRMRCAYITASVLKYMRGLWAFAAQVRQTAADCRAARVHQPH